MFIPVRTKKVEQRKREEQILCVNDSTRFGVITDFSDEITNETNIKIKLSDAS